MQGSETVPFNRVDDELAELINDDGDDDAGDESAHERIDAINRRLDELSESKETYLAEDKARSGVVVYVNYHGKLEAAIGVINDEDETGEEDGPDADPGSQASHGPAKEAETAAVAAFPFEFPPPESARRGIELRRAL